MELGFRKPIVDGFSHSLSCIPDSKDQDSGFHKHKFFGLQSSEAKMSRIPDSPKRGDINKPVDKHGTLIDFYIAEVKATSKT